MKRYLSVWLPGWPIERRSGSLASKQGNALPPDRRAPLVLSTMAKNGALITAASPAAEQEGFAPGMTIADARAINPSLHVEAADEDGDLEALHQLALWCQRYSPLTRIEAPDGVCLDITGCAHLFGGELQMAEDLADRLHSFGVTSRIAITPTIGAGWALARHGTDEICVILDQGIQTSLASLPVTALRLQAETLSALAKVGLNTIGLLEDKPRPPLASRFGSGLLYRLDQAMGKRDEAFNPLHAPPHYRADCRFAEPIITLEAVEIATRQLVDTLTDSLFQAGKATRRLELLLYRVDGWQERLGLRISSLTRNPAHLSRLLCERLDRIKDNAGFGFEAASLGAFDTEDSSPLQQDLRSGGSIQDQESDIAQLLDRLINRFGGKNISRFLPRSSYLPEYASAAISVLEPSGNNDWERHNTVLQGGKSFARPFLIFDRPENITAIFEAPDNPPASFKWRNISHRIVRADGPERISPEWWQPSKTKSQTRDYYRVEDEIGHRFWIYRDGLFERASETPKWFIHGLFS